MKNLVEYLYIHKSGLKDDLVKNFGEDYYITGIYSKLLVQSVNKKEQISWKISEFGYDLYELTYIKNTNEIEDNISKKEKYFKNI